MNSTNRIKDSYHLRIWLTGEAIGFLDSLYPEDEPEVALSRLLDREMYRHRDITAYRTAERQIEALEELLAERDAEIKQLYEEVKELRSQMEELRSKPAEVPQKPAEMPLEAPTVIEGDSPEDNPINRLQELCHQRRKPLPRYTFEVGGKGFRVFLFALGLETEGIGKSKASAKKVAAQALLDRLEAPTKRFSK